MHRLIILMHERLTEAISNDGGATSFRQFFT